MIFGAAATKGSCPVCRTPSCGCGPEGTGLTPIDIPQEGFSMASSDLKVYDVEINGQRTQMKLTADHAKRLGATEVKTASKPAASNKKRITKSES